MAISTWREKAQAKESRGGLPYVSMKEDGKYVFRFFTIVHKVTKTDYLIGRYPKAAIGEEAEELFITHRVHFGPMMDCPEFVGNEGNEAHCERCDAARQLMDDPRSDKKTKEDARRNGLAAEKRVFVVICISEPSGRKRPTDGFLVFDATSRKIVEELGTIHDEFMAKRKPVFGWSGRDIVIVKNSTKPPQDVYKVRVQDSEENTVLKPELVGGATVPDLYAMARYAPPSMRHLFPKDGEAAAAPAAEAAKAPAKAPATRKPAAKAKAPWPPSEGQDVLLTFDDGSTAPGVVLAVLEDGKFKVSFQIDADIHEADVELADMKVKE